VALGLLAVIASPGGPVLLAPPLGLAHFCLLPEFFLAALAFILAALLMAAGYKDVQLSLELFAVRYVHAEATHARANTDGYSLRSMGLTSSGIGGQLSLLRERSPPRGDL